MLEPIHDADDRAGRRILAHVDRLAERIAFGEQLVGQRLGDDDRGRLQAIAEGDVGDLLGLEIAPGDQLDAESSAFDGFDPAQDALWMAEVAEIARWATAGLVPDLTVLLDLEPERAVGTIADPDRPWVPNLGRSRTMTRCRDHEAAEASTVAGS